jgi:hypothetical protein
VKAYQLLRWSMAMLLPLNYDVYHALDWYAVKQSWSSLASWQRTSQPNEHREPAWFCFSRGLPKPEIILLSLCGGVCSSCYSMPKKYAVPPLFEYALAGQLPVDIPLSIEGYDAQWFTTVLRAQKLLPQSGSVTGVTATEIGAGNGLCFYFRCSVVCIRLSTSWSVISLYALCIMYLL